ncbi:MAG: hypothetical protein ACLPJH_18365 [Myxococcaceae bacterium]
MKLEDLPPHLRDAAASMQTLAGDAYGKARAKFLDALAQHTGDLDKAKQQAEDILEQARSKSSGFLEKARAKSEQVLTQAQGKSEDFLKKAKEQLEKK